MKLSISDLFGTRLGISRICKEDSLFCQSFVSSQWCVRHRKGKVGAT